MSYDYIVFAQRKNLPSASAVEAHLRDQAPPVEVPGFPDWAELDGILPMQRGGDAVDFEFFTSEIEPGEATRFRKELGKRPKARELNYLHILETCDFELIITCQGAKNIEAGRVVALELARLSRGYFRDPQSSETTSFAADKS